MQRRDFITLTASTAAASALPLAAATSADVRFVFFTDTHLQPELKGDVGTAKALAKIALLKPEFCIQGGDLCFDLNTVPRERSQMLLDLYAHTESALKVPVHHVLGNHDLFGSSAKSGIAEDDSMFGKRAFEQRYGKTYRSWDYKGYHFVVLDAIQITPDRQFNAWVDDAQREWLAADLAATKLPIVVTVHCPLVSAAPQYDRPFINSDPAAAKYHTYLVGNAYQVLPLFEGHNIIAVLQGHTHLNETVFWRNIPFITSGAVCGNWWRGSLLGTPEGFTVFELRDGHAHWHYETYGWQSEDPKPSPLSPLTNPRITA